MGDDGKLASIFKMICVSIIYSVRIINIANKEGRFIMSDRLQSLNAYQIPHDILTISDRNMYLYCHTHKALIALSSQNIRLNQFPYLQYICRLATSSPRHIYSGDHPNHNTIIIDHVLSSRTFINNCSKT